LQLVDAASYRTPSLQILPPQPHDVVGSDIGSFCPAWSEAAAAGRGNNRLSIDNLFGIYALTTQGQHFFRAFSGSERKTVSTTVIANGIIAQSSFVDPSKQSFVVAHAEKSIHLSVHRPEWKRRAPAHLLKTTVPISQCFVHANHIVVCTHDRIALLCTRSLTVDGVTKGVTAERGEETAAAAADYRLTAYGVIYRSVDDEDLRASLVGTSNGRVYSIAASRLNE
ncbi:hypothetical protein PFISCL1PPCAC_22147, partial [Pristionchus fissidentatus]